MKKQFLLLVALATMVTFPSKAWDKLYLIGTATDAGFDATAAIEMETLSESEFTWTGYLYAGELKFLTTNASDGWVNMYGPAHNEFSTTNEGTSYNQLYPNVTYDLQFFNPFGEGLEATPANPAYSDYKFGVEAGWYTLHVRTDLMQVTTWPRVVYPVGTGCEVGWSTEGTKYFEETGFGSGAYQGTLELKKKAGEEGDSPEVKFLCQKDYAAHFGPANVGDGQHDIYGAGKYDIAFENNGDRKFWVLDGAEGTYNMTLDAAAGTLYIVPQTIVVKAQIELSALEKMGSVNCHVWVNGASQDKDQYNIVPTYDGWFSMYVSDVYRPINFLFFGMSGDTWSIQTPDMTNDNNGYYGDKCCTIYGATQEDGKLICYHNDACEVLEQKVTLEFKVKDGTTLSFEDNDDLYLRQWQWFYAEGAGEPGDHETFTKLEKDFNGIYSVEVPAVNTVKLVLQHLADGWNPVSTEAQTLSSKKYWIEAAEAGAEHPYVLTETETFDSTTTLESFVTTVNDNVVYDVTGRALGTSTANLPQGLYIRNGKTFVVVR